MTMPANSRRKAPAPPPGQRKLFLDDLAQRLVTIEDLLLRIASAPATAHDPLERLRRQAHDIKGTGAAFGVPAATEIARELEQHLKASAEAGPADLPRLRGFIDRLRALLGSR